MKRNPLGRTGLQVSRLSFGASSLGGVFRTVDEDEAVRAVHVALDAGINYLDVAPAYGATRAETVLGRALREVPRARYFLSTKVGKYTHPGAYGDDTLDYSRARIRASLDESAARIGVEYFDIVHLHDIEYQGRKHTEWALGEGLEALRELKREGRIGAVGFGIYPMDLWHRVLADCDPDAALVHNHYCLNDTRLLELLPVARRTGVGIINGSPFGSGLLTDRGPADWHPARRGRARRLPAGGRVLPRAGDEPRQARAPVREPEPGDPDDALQLGEPGVGRAKRRVARGAVRPVAGRARPVHPGIGEGQAMELLIGRATLALAAATFLATPAQSASASELPASGGRTYRVAGRFLERDGKAAFLVGANYIPPRDWLANLRTWDAPTVEADMAALERLGVRTIRWFPLWPLTQPDPDAIDETVLHRVDEVVRLAGRHHIDVQISPLTGWMSGYFVLPPWARGVDLFVDPKALAAEKRLVGHMATRYRGNPAVQGFDFGNELNVVVEFVRTKATVPGMEAWMDAIYRAFKSGSPEHLVTNGIGTGFTKEFNVDAIARTSDYVSVHSYPGVHRTSRMDPFLGQRTTYSVNYMIEWAATTGKPVLMQETGVSNTEVTDADMSRILSVTLASSWAEGAAGYFWWCSHDNSPTYRIPEDLVWKEPSLLKDLKTGEMMGLLTNDNREKPVGRRFRELGGLARDPRRRLGAEEPGRLRARAGVRRLLGHDDRSRPAVRARQADARQGALPAAEGRGPGRRRRGRSCPASPCPRRRSARSTPGCERAGASSSPSSTTSPPTSRSSRASASTPRRSSGPRADSARSRPTSTCACPRRPSGT